MDFNLEDDDPDAAAMAEAMGFSGFGSQRPAKRKFNANADAAVSSAPQEKKGGYVSKTGANNAPLGVRRPLNLPAPTSNSSGGMADTRNAEEIDLEEDDRGLGGADDQGVVDLEVKNKVTQALQTPGGYQSEDADSMVAQPPTHTVVDNGPPGLPSRPPNQQIFMHSHGRHQGRAGQGGPRHVGPVGTAGAPWWEGYYDAKMNENPWEKLERERGLQPRGTWLARKAGHGSLMVEVEASGPSYLEAP